MESGMEKSYQKLYAQYCVDLEDATDRPLSLMGEDKKRKWNACTEVLLLEALHKQCVQQEVAPALFSWIFARIHNLQRTCECY